MVELLGRVGFAQHPQQSGVPTLVVEAIGFADGAQLTGHGVHVLIRDAELKQEFLPFAVTLGLQEQRERVRVRVGFEYGSQVGCDLPAQSVLPTVAVEVVVQHCRTAAGGRFEEEVTCAATAEPLGLVDAVDARMDY